MRKASALLFMYVLPVIVMGQFRHMHYNLTLYGNPFGCDETNNNTDDKDAALKVIIDHVQPDILTVNELHDQNIWADRILDDVLNDEEMVWDRAELSAQFTLSSILNGLFFRSDKFTLLSQETVYQNVDGGPLLRPIDIYHFYVIDEGVLIGDTTHLSCVVAHLAATDEVERSEQTEALMQRLEEIGPRNYILSGDLNMDSAFEEAFQNLVSHPDESLAFDDPITSSSTWNNNPSVADYHTQSTRLSDTNNGCFAGGGLDDRFDLTLLAPSIGSGSNGIAYISGSYTVLGQNGNDFNQELQTVDNGVVPDEVAMALYEMSDHLPVITNYATELIIGMSAFDEAPPINIQQVDQSICIQVSSIDSYEIHVFDILGKEIQVLRNPGNSTCILDVQKSGIYLISLRSNRWAMTRKILID